MWESTEFAGKGSYFRSDPTTWTLLPRRGTRWFRPIFEFNHPNESVCSVSVLIGMRELVLMAERKRVRHWRGIASPGSTIASPEGKHGSLTTPGYGNYTTRPSRKAPNQRAALLESACSHPAILTPEEMTRLIDSARNLSIT